MFQNITQIMKNKLFFIDFKQIYLAVKNLIALLRGILSKHHGDFYGLDSPSFFCNRKKLNHIKSM